jgi:hypothetical protein
MIEIVIVSMTSLRPQSIPPPLPPRAMSLPTVSSVEWTKTQLEVFNAEIKPVEKLAVAPSKGDVPAIPEQLLDMEDSGRDFLVQSFLDNLSVVQTMFMSLDDDEGRVSRGPEGYTKQLLYDFMRVLLLANKTSLKDVRIGYVLGGERG